MHHRPEAGQLRLKGQPAGEGGRRVDHIAPHLITQHPQAPLQAEATQGLEFIAAKAAAQGVVGVAQAQHPGAGGHQGLQRRQIQGGLGFDPPQHRHPAGAADGVGEEKVDRIPDDRLVTGGEPVAGHQGQTGGRTVHRHHPFRQNRRPPLPQVAGHPLAEGAQPAGGAVAEHPGAGVVGDGVADDRRRREIGIGGGEGDHPGGLLGPAQVVGPLTQQVERHRPVAEAVGEAIAHAISGSWSPVDDGWTKDFAIWRPASTQPSSDGRRWRS